MRIIAFGIGVVVLTACSSGETETVKYSDLSPNSKGKNHEVDSTDAVKNERPEKSVYLNLVDTLRGDDNWKKWDTLLFADRFGARTSEKWIVKDEKDSLILLNFTFKDSLQTRNALFNWLDCFGPNCTSYTVGGDLKLKGKYLYLFVDATSIYYIESQSRLKQELLRTVFNKKPDKENWMYMVQSKPGAKAEWKRVTKGVATDIKNSYENIE